MKHIKYKLKGDGKPRLTQGCPSPCRGQWGQCLGRGARPGLWDRREPGQAVPHHPDPRSCKCSDGTPAGQGRAANTKSHPDLSHTCSSAALLHTTSHLGKKTHLHCCFLFCLLTHFFKYFYQTLFWYLGKSNKMWINTLWEMLSIKQLNHNFFS